MLNIPSNISDPSYRYKMPRLQTKTECRGNGIKTSVGNIADVARCLKIPPQYLIKFFGYELGAITKYEDKENEGIRAIVMGNHENGHMQKLLDKFIEAFILCPTCKLPEIDLKVKSGDILGLCKACGFNGPLKDAIEHKLCTFVSKNPPNDFGSKNEDSAKKKDKATRQREKAERARIAAKGGQANSDDDVENEDGNAEKTRKSKKDKKDKKEKKEKKEKKDRKEGGKRSKAIEASEEEEEEESQEDEKELEYSDEVIVDMIERIKPLKDKPLEEFFEELRLCQIAAEIDSKMRFYVGIEALFSTKEDFKAANVEKKTSYLSKMMKHAKPQLGTDEVMWGFEHLIFNHAPELNSTFPMVCKALYDEEIVEEKHFISHYAKDLTNPGFAEAKKLAAPFIQWLETADSDEDSSEEEEESD